VKVLRRSGKGGRPTRIFFAADLHGSQPTFRKFLNAASFYDVDALVFGGDLMGKALVPIVKTNGTYRARFDGEDHEFDGDGLDAFCRSLEQPGFYWKVMDRDEYEATNADPSMQLGLFVELARGRLREWIERSEERLGGTGVRMYLTGGNDDEPGVLDVLGEAAAGGAVVPCEGTVIDLDGEHTMITVGLSTPTPWDTPREASELVIASAIDDAAGLVPDVGRCVFNLHCPPKDTPIDTCLKLDATNLAPGEFPRPVRRGGRFLTTGGGSVAVREAVARYQPTVALHGHIHESGGRFRIGRTQCLNPGSEYVQGTLNGWIVALRGGVLSGYQHTSG
jgi:Icc-related predicted phosphoesterase